MEMNEKIINALKIIVDKEVDISTLLGLRDHYNLYEIEFIERYGEVTNFHKLTEEEFDLVTEVTDYIEGEYFKIKRGF